MNTRRETKAWEAKLRQWARRNLEKVGVGRRRARRMSRQAVREVREVGCELKGPDACGQCEMLEHCIGKMLFCEHDTEEES